MRLEFFTLNILTYLSLSPLLSLFLSPLLSLSLSLSLSLCLCVSFAVSITDYISKMVKRKKQNKLLFFPTISLKEITIEKSNRLLKVHL